MRRGLALVIAFAAGAMTIAKLACAPYEGATVDADAAAPGGDAAAASDAGEGGDGAGDGGDGGVALCATDAGGVLLCDDFEGAVEPRTEWTPNNDAGTLEVTTVAARPGHVLRVGTAQANATVALDFQHASPDFTTTDVTLDLDFAIEVPGFEYVGITTVVVANAGAGTAFGIAMQSGTTIGDIQNPGLGTVVPVDGAWHHLRLAFTHMGGPREDVDVDGTHVTSKTADLPAPSTMAFQIGVLTTVAGPTQGPASVLLDDIVVRTE